jgi:hypothetical protein
MPETKMTACSWWNGETERCFLSIEICIWNTQRKRLNYHLTINSFGRLHKWGEKNKTHLTRSKTLPEQEFQKGNGRHNKKRKQTMTQWGSEWLNFSVIFNIGKLRNQIICVSQLIACVPLLTWQTVMTYRLQCM